MQSLMRDGTGHVEMPRCILVCLIDPHMRTYQMPTLDSACQTAVTDEETSRTLSFSDDGHTVEQDLSLSLETELISTSPGT